MQGTVHPSVSRAGHGYQIVLNHDLHILVKFSLKLYLKYHNGDAAIRGIKRISKPGRRTYVSSRNIPKVLSGLGIAIITTSSGVMTDKLCREKSVGGEVLGHVW